MPDEEWIRRPVSSIGPNAGPRYTRGMPPEEWELSCGYRFVVGIWVRPNDADVAIATAKKILPELLVVIELCKDQKLYFNEGENPSPPKVGNPQYGSMVRLNLWAETGRVLSIERLF